MLKKILFMALCLMLIAIPFSPKYIINKAVNATYIKPSLQYIEDSIYCRGKVTSQNEAEIYTDTPVLPKEILCQIGQEVKKGDRLALIDREKTTNILSEASTLEMGMNKIYDLISKLPNAEILYTVGEAYGIGKEQIDEIFNAIKYQKSENTVLYVPEEITAPFDGTITALNISENVLSTHNKPAIVISSCDDIVIEADIPQEYAEKVTEGMEIQILCNDNIDIGGKVEFVHPTAETSGYTESVVKVVIKPYSADKLRIGYDVQVKLTIRDEEKSLTIPVEAIQQDENNNEYVYVFSNAAVAKKNIETGVETPYFSQIKSGIEADELIIIPEKPLDSLKHIFIKGERNEG